MHTGQKSLALTESIRLLEGRNYDAAIKALQQHISMQADGESEALLALAYFHKEAYALAAQHYQAALTYQPDNKDWQEMLALARANSTAAIHAPVPDFYYFERDKLLALPVVPSGALPTPLPPPSAPGLFKRILLVLGNCLGEVGTFMMNGLTRLWGKIAGYRDAVWTNWYRRPLLLGILTLAYMREQLNAHNLKNTYPPESLTGFVPQGLTPPEGVTHFRTADGSWNNLANPKEGAAGTRFTRNVAREAIRPETGDTLLTPNPREISRILLTREGDMKEVPFLNLLAATWIQFENHDWINHGEVVMKSRPRSPRWPLSATQHHPTPSLIDISWHCNEP